MHVRIWCSDSSDNSFDDVQVHDLAGPYEVDGRWFWQRGAVWVDDSDNNVMEVYGDNSGNRPIVRRGFRGDKFVFTFRFKWVNGGKPGCLVRWADPGNWMGIHIACGDGKARLIQRKDAEDSASTLSTSATGLSLTDDNWYTGKVVIDDDPGDSAHRTANHKQKPPATRNPTHRTTNRA